MTNKGLGRGLGSLFGSLDDEEEKKPAPIKEETKEQVDIIADGAPQEVDINLIDRNPSQPRKTFNDDQITELAQSIKNCGLIQPIITVMRNNRYMIVSGERRWRASKKAGLKRVPVIVRNYTDAEIAEVALIENLQREDLNPIESAQAIKELIDKYNLTQEQISEKIGKSRSAVTNTLRLLSLCPQVIKMIKDGQLSAGHGKILVAITDTESQYKIATMAVEGKISVRELEKYLQALANRTERSTSSKKPLSLELQDFSNKLQQALSTKVQIKGTDRKGKIVIEYYNKDDLNRIYNLFN